MKTKLMIISMLLILITTLAHSQIRTVLLCGVTQVFQAEDAAMLSEADVESNMDGYSGNSYVNFLNKTGNDRLLPIENLKLKHGGQK